MNFYLLPPEKVFDFFTILSEDGVVFYSIVENNSAHLIKFDKDREFKPNFIKIRTAENIKHFLFPSREVLSKFPRDIQIKRARQYLFGMKNCDLRGIDVYDRVFLKWEPIDPFYKERRDNTIIISADCPEPEDCCFCNLVGLNPYGEGICDINFTPTSSGLLFEVFTQRGERIIKKAGNLFRSPGKDDEKERDINRKAAIKQLETNNQKPFDINLPEVIEKADKNVIRNARDECVECFACLHGCPTCYCFLLGDYKKGDNEMVRVRTWDTCYYAAYARVGGGANPRSKLDERFWHRFQCKFNYFYQYEKFYACSGCGRCYRGCSALIDIRKILWQ